MRKISKALKISIIGLLSVIIIGSFAIYAFVIKRPTAIPEIVDTKPYEWNRVELGEKVQSSNGSGYHLLTKKGENRNWIIFFSGGGVSWDQNSAAHPIKLKNLLSGKDSGNYFPNIPFYLLSLLGGMFDNKNPNNPFREWNIVYIPYSTGDFHVGKHDAEYKKDDGSSFTMHYNGQNNVQSSLEWIYANVDKPEKLLIAGESAGGFGSAFWAGEISNHYKESEIYQYSDSSFLKSDKWPEVVDKEWHADFEKTFGFAAESDLIGSAFKGNRRLLPANIVLLQSYSLYDEILIHFQNKINDYTGPLDEKNISDWSRQMRQSVKELASTLPNYYYYLTDYDRNNKGTTSHTFSSQKTFYKAEQDGVKLLTWLDDIINNQNNYSVGSKFLEELDQ
ncbi:pectin acetylesterase-family hydrolase [Cohnella abietis]|uniref:Pectinacetylesterase n=1 Tax=Cohnella abietis TaxID=2507935 RepID=A0A3T1D5A3_9BACL|nr:pectin acetylesterase-family hydrolase [Cohnella abietis]BBI33293.1 hypothetical protein KCTCHS21_26920 [Cohnella abietis]